MVCFTVDYGFTTRYLVGNNRVFRGWSSDGCFMWADGHAYLRKRNSRRSAPACGACCGKNDATLLPSIDDLEENTLWTPCRIMLCHTRSPFGLGGAQVVGKPSHK